MRFMVIIKADAKTEAGEMPSERLLTEMGKYNEELVKAGVMLAGEGLHRAGRRVSSGSKRTVIDGPFPETKELVAGFWLIQVKSKEEAIEWVSYPELDGADTGRDPAGLRGRGLRPGVHVRRASRRRFRPSSPVDGIGFLTVRTSTLAPERRGGVIGMRDCPRHPSHHRRGLEDRVREVDCRPHPCRPRRGDGRRPRAGRPARGARAVAEVGRAG